MLEQAHHSASNTEATLNCFYQQIPTTLTLDPAYVSVRGVRHANIETDDFDFDQYIDEFLSDDRKILLILGDLGAGESLYEQYLVH